MGAACMQTRIYPLGDSAIVISFGDQIGLETHHAVMRMIHYLENHDVPGVLEFVPAFTTVAFYYNPLKTHYSELESRLQGILANLPNSAKTSDRVIEIPVCYGGEFGPDLQTVAQHTGLSAEEVITIHTSVDYLVYMIGFSPGFPYLGGMSAKIATPRLASPRLSVPAGSVGIAGHQTGVYPTSSPGGWQLIGRTPLALFRPEQEPPSLLAAGDFVRFRSISYEEYQSLCEESLAP